MPKPISDLIERLGKINQWLERTQKLTQNKIKNKTKFNEVREEKTLTLLTLVQAELAVLEVEKNNLNKNDPRAERISVIIEKLNDKARLLGVSLEIYREAALDRTMRAAPDVPSNEPEYKVI